MRDFLLSDNEQHVICDLALQIRKDILDMTYATGNTGAHIGGSLSLVEILAVLYKKHIRYERANPLWEERDRVILSKGHAAMALYAALTEVGIIDKLELESFKKDGSRLGGHPSLNGLAGIEFASGSLGQGLSLGVGVSMALKKKGNSVSKVYVLLGDGECNEGEVWEAAVCASHYHLNNLIAIIDVNGLQYDGDTTEIMDMTPFGDKWKSFGWNIVEIDGHDVCQVDQALSVDSDKPLAIVAKTVKGKGISFAENNIIYHNASISHELYQKALGELGLGDAIDA